MLEIDRGYINGNNDVLLTVLDQLNILEHYYLCFEDMTCEYIELRKLMLSWIIDRCKHHRK